MKQKVEKKTNKKVKKQTKPKKEEVIIEEKRHATFNLVEVIIIVFITIVLVSVTSGMLVFHNYEKLNNTITGNDKYLDELTKTYNNILEDYVDRVDKEELITSAIEGMFQYLDDPNSSYLNKEETDILNERLNGTYEGVGVEIINTEKGVQVNRVFHDTPANKVGIKKGDIISKINNTNVRDKTGSFISNYIRYKLDKKFTMEIFRNGKTIKYMMKKEKIDYPVVYIERYKKTGYIYLSAFSNTSTKQFKNGLEDLEKQKIKNLVIDLRSNTGGYLNTAYEISDLFLPKNKVVYKLKTKKGITAYKSKTKKEKDYDIVILINGKSASASEILTLALKENKKNVTIVGEKSYGKGTVQQAKDLEDGAMVKYTTAKWLSPKGESIDEKGIMPDYTVIYDSKSTSKIDNQLQKALDVLK